MDKRFAEYIDEPQLRWLYLHWLRLKAGRLPPPRERLDPLALRHLLPEIFVIEVDRVAQRFRYRLAGAEVEHMMQAKLHGRWLDEAVISPLREFFDEAFCIAAFERKVQYRKNTLHLAGRPYIRYARLLLPLSTDGSTIDHLLGCIRVDEAMSRYNPSQVAEVEITISDIEAYERDAYDADWSTDVEPVASPADAAASPTPKST